MKNVLHSAMAYVVWYCWTLDPQNGAFVIFKSIFNSVDRILAASWDRCRRNPIPSFSNPKRRCRNWFRTHLVWNGNRLPNPLWNSTKSYQPPGKQHRVEKESGDTQTRVKAHMKEFCLGWYLVIRLKVLCCLHQPIECPNQFLAVSNWISPKQDSWRLMDGSTDWPINIRLTRMQGQRRQSARCDYVQTDDCSEDRQTGGQINMHTGRQVDMQTGRQRDMQTGGQVDMQTGRQIEMRTGRHADRRTDRHADR